MKKQSAKNIFLMLFGSLLYGIGTHCFVVPSQIAPGGASGIAIMINFLTELPVGTLTFIINIPLLLLAWRYVSRSFVINTSIACIASAVILDGFVAKFIPQYIGDRMVGSLFGGVFVGIGMALIFLSGSTTGGSDILGKLFKKRFPHVSMGRALLIIDGIILSSSIFVFGNIESALFGMINLFTCTQIIDSIMYGLDKGAHVTVVTSKPEAISKKIIEHIERSATIMQAKGAYSGEATHVLLCVVRKSEFYLLRSVIYEADPKAFLMVTESTEVYGEGFKDITPHH